MTEADLYGRLQLPEQSQASDTLEPGHFRDEIPSECCGIQGASVEFLKAYLHESSDY